MSRTQRYMWRKHLATQIISSCDTWTG